MHNLSYIVQNEDLPNIPGKNNPGPAMNKYLIVESTLTNHFQIAKFHRRLFWKATFEKYEWAKFRLIPQALEKMVGGDCLLEIV